MSLKRELLRALIYGLLAIVVVLVVVRSVGQRIAFTPADLERTPPAGEVDFEVDGIQPRLEQPATEPPPRNLILLMGDGMGFSHITATRAEVVGLNRRLQMERMPITAWLNTHALTSLGTDSAAGATAIATGQKVRPGRLSLTKNGRALRTIAEEAIARGMSVGLVTDSYLWDATTSAFVVHVESRREYTEVARQMALSGAELLMGTVRGNFRDESEEGQTQLGFYTEAGYTVVRDWETLEQRQTPGKLVALLPKDHIGDPQRAPSLTELVDIAIERLSKNPGGFFLLVESEEPDTASHAHDFQRMVRGVASLDEAVGRALEFAREDAETLVMVTADHETGGLALLNASPGGKMEVEWASFGHPATPVPFFAYGPGAERFSGVLDNTDPPKRIAEMMGFDLESEGEIR